MTATDRVEDPGSLDEDDGVIAVERDGAIDSQLGNRWDKAAKRPKRGPHIATYPAMLPSNEEELERCLADPEWRLFSGCLYQIIVKGDPAKDENGKPVRLVEADSLNIPIEAPGAGDLLANPFYDPERPVAIAVSDADAAAADNARRAVEMLGGVPKRWNTSEKVEYAVVKNRDAFDATKWETVPRVVTIEHLCRYYEPLPRVVEETPPPCPGPNVNCLPIR